MENDTKELEDRLSALQPAPVPEGTEARVLEIFDGEIPLTASPDFAEADKVIPFPLWRRLGAVAAVLVACTGVFFALLNNFGPTPDGGTIANKTTPANPAAPTFHPVSAEDVFEGIRDGGVFLSEDGEPVRELHYHFSNSFRWENPDDGSVIEMKVPRERNFLVPVRTD